MHSITWIFSEIAIRSAEQLTGSPRWLESRAGLVETGYLRPLPVNGERCL
jgi:hypothetical protein